MDIKIETYSALPCNVELFTINGVDADEFDFGDSERSGDCFEYCCNNDFTPYEVPQENVLEKYQINKDEYDEICEMLKEKLCVRSCGWCS